MKKSVLLVFALVAVAGCIRGGVTVDSNNGVSIQRFAASPVEEKTGGLVLFDIELENVGGTTATDVKVELFGVERQWRESDGSLITDTQDKFGNIKLNPPNLQRQTPGGFKLTQWQLMTPEIPQGVTFAYPVTARVTYGYNTSGFLIIPAVSDQEYEIRRIQDQPIDTPQIVNSEGPIKITIPESFRRHVIVDTEDTDPEESIPLRIEFINVGDGFPVTEGDAGKITGTIRLFGPGAEFEDCLGATSGTEVSLDNSDIPTTLRDTQSVPVACTIKIDKSSWGDRPEDSFSLVFNIFYTYFVRDTVKITVFGR